MKLIPAPVLALILAFPLLIQSCKKEKGDPDSFQQVLVGPSGTDGSNLFAGTTGPGGSTGRIGDYYINTSNANIYGPKTSGGWGGSFSLLLPGQTVDSSGRTVMAGTGLPTNAMGANGDYFLDTVKNVFFGPKRAGVWNTMGLELRGTNGQTGTRSFITAPFNSFAGPIFYELPGVTEQMLESGYVAGVWRREQLLVNPGFYRQYPLPYTFEYTASGNRYLATLYHYLVRGGQLGVTIVTSGSPGYDLPFTNDFRYNFRFIYLDRGTVGKMAGRNPGLNPDDPEQLNKLLGLE